MKITERFCHDLWFAGLCAWNWLQSKSASHCGKNLMNLYFVYLNALLISWRMKREWMFVWCNESTCLLRLTQNSQTSSSCWYFLQRKSKIHCIVSWDVQLSRHTSPPVGARYTMVEMWAPQLVFKATSLSPLCGPGSSVGIATGYERDGPGIESRWGRDFPHLSRPSLGPTQPPVQWVPAFSRG